MKNQAQGSPTPPTTAETKPKATRIIGEGVLIGRAAQKINEIADEKATELASLPASLDAKYAAKLDAALKHLNTDQRATAALLANQMRPAKQAAE